MLALGGVNAGGPIAKGVGAVIDWLADGAWCKPDSVIANVADAVCTVRQCCEQVFCSLFKLPFLRACQMYKGLEVNELPEIS